MATQPDPVNVILGSTGGIGSEVSRHLARHNARLVLGARSGDPLGRLAEEVGGMPAPLDAEIYGRLDGIANCVGSILLKPAPLTSVEEFQDTLALNLHSAFFTVKAAARLMMRKEKGSIALVSSAVTRTGIINHKAIAKAAPKPHTVGRGHIREPGRARQLRGTGAGADSRHRADHEERISRRSRWQCTRWVA